MRNLEEALDAVAGSARAYLRKADENGPDPDDLAVPLASLRTAVEEATIAFRGPEFDGELSPEDRIRELEIVNATIANSHFAFLELVSRGVAMSAVARAVLRGEGVTETSLSREGMKAWASAALAKGLAEGLLGDAPNYAAIELETPDGRGIEISVNWKGRTSLSEDLVRLRAENDQRRAELNRKSVKSGGRWTSGYPTPEEADRHANDRTFHRDEADEPGEVVPAYGLWAARLRDPATPWDAIPVILAVRALDLGAPNARLEFERYGGVTGRPGGFYPETATEWMRLDVNGEPVEPG